MRTGIGAAREDVNVSVTGGTRVEIKGVPRIPRIPLLTYNEAMRQWNLLRLREELAPPGHHRRDVQVGDRGRHQHPPADELPAPPHGPRGGRRRQRRRPPRLRRPPQLADPDEHVFLREVSDRVRVIACLTTLPNIAHSDSPSESFSSAEWEAVRRALKATRDDAAVVVWGGREDAKTGAQEITIRAREAAVGVPSETRQALHDGTNGFERILPGPDRMYPDTDLPPKTVGEDRLEAIRRSLPVRSGRGRPSTATSTSRRTWPGRWPPRRSPVSTTSLSANGRSTRPWPPWSSSSTPSGCGGRGAAAAVPSEDNLKRIFELYKDGRISRDGIYPAMSGALPLDPPPEAVTPAEVEAAVARAAERLALLRLHNPEKKAHVLTGLVMTGLRGRADGAAVAGRVRAFLEGRP